MSYYTKGKIEECSELPQYKDPKTGELGKRQFIVQVKVTSLMKNGNSRKDIIDIKIDESKVNEYKSMIGKEQEFSISLYSKSPISLTAI